MHTCLEYKWMAVEICVDIKMFHVWDFYHLYFVLLMDFYEVCTHHLHLTVVGGVRGTLVWILFCRNTRETKW